MSSKIKVDGQEEKTVNMIKESHNSGKSVVLLDLKSSSFNSGSTSFK